LQNITEYNCKPLQIQLTKKEGGAKFITEITDIEVTAYPEGSIKTTLRICADNACHY
jgi:hypothetical protein